MDIIGKTCAIRDMVFGSSEFAIWIKAVGIDQFTEGKDKVEKIPLSDFPQYKNLFRIEEIDNPEPCDLGGKFGYGYDEENCTFVYIRSLKDKSKGLEIPLAWIRLF